MGMTTMPIRRYAEKHGLSPIGLADLLGATTEEKIEPDDEAAISTLDDLRESIYEMAIEDLVTAREDLDAAREEVRNMEVVLQSSVKEALLEGLPAARIAQVLGVSRARVYQLRDGKR